VTGGTRAASLNFDRSPFFDEVICREQILLSTMFDDPDVKIAIPARRYFYGGIFPQGHYCGSMM
jgi:hypothetical protein